MARYFKVIKDNFLWLSGAVLAEYNGHASYSGYRPIDNSNIWDYSDKTAGEYIHSRVIENCPEYFVEVYPVNLLTKTVYKIKEEARALMAKDYE